MKKVLLFLMVGIFSINTSFANDSDLDQDIEKVEIKLVSENDEYHTTYVFEYDSIKDVQEFNINELFDVTDEDCSVTATVTVSSTITVAGDVGVASSSNTITTTVSASVTASCAEIAQAVKNLAKELRAGIQ